MNTTTGCADCNANVTIYKDPQYRNISHMQIEHDDTCPFYIEYQNRAQRRASR